MTNKALLSINVERAKLRHRDQAVVACIFNPITLEADRSLRVQGHLGLPEIDPVSKRNRAKWQWLTALIPLLGSHIYLIPALETETGRNMSGQRELQGRRKQELKAFSPRFSRDRIAQIR